MKNYRFRKSHRLKNYNYSTNGSYFITICVKNKECLLGDIVGGDVHGAPEPTENINDLIYAKASTAHMVLSEYGKIVKEHIETGKEKLTDLSIDNYVIMPNHIHLILSVQNDNFICSVQPCHDRIPQYISSLKTLTTKQIGFPIFQRDYHDHIIRDETEYEKIWGYIDTNVSNWVADRFYMY